LCRSLSFWAKQVSPLDDLARRFPPPWSVEELETCFVVKGQCRGSAEAAELFCSGDSEKLHNAFDAFDHLLLRFVAFGHLGRRPLSAGRKQPFKGRADSRIGIKLSGDDANSYVIPIRSRPVIAANCIGKALDQGVQEKALRPLAVPKKVVLPTVHN
jgi:hypothetical protein